MKSMLSSEIVKLCIKRKKVVDHTISQTAAESSKIRTDHGIGKVRQEPDPCRFSGFRSLKPEKGELRESGRGRKTYPQHKRNHSASTHGGYTPSPNFNE